MRVRCFATMCLVSLVAVLLRPNPAEAQQTGGQWSEPVDITQPSDSNPHAYGILLCDPYQNVHLFWADLSEDGAAVFYRNDISESWSFPNDVLAMPDAVIAELAGDISTDTDTVHLVWLSNYAEAALYYSQAPLLNADQAKSWSRPFMLANGVYNADIEVDSAGVIHVVYGIAGDGARSPTVFHVSSQDGGSTWSNPVVVFTEVFDLESFPRVKMDIDRKDAIHLGITVRSVEYGAYSEVGYVRSLDAGRTWSKYVTVEKMGTTFQGVHMIAPFAFGEDEVHLTWHDPRRMHMWSFDGGTTWNGPDQIMSLGAAFGGTNELAQDSSGKIHVLTTVGNGVYSAEWNGAEWETPQQIDARNIDPHRQDMTICQGNQLHVVYDDRIGDRIVWYASRRVAAPRIERQPLPRFSSVPTPFPAPTDPATSDPQTTPGVAGPGSESSVAAGAAPAQSESNPLLLLLLPAVPVLLLLVATFILWSWRGHQHGSYR